MDSVDTIEDPFALIDNNSRQKLKENKKKPCEVCGSDTNELLIMTCFKCRDTREHIYCARVLFQRVPPFWLCEECHLSPWTPSMDSVEASQLAVTIVIEPVVVNEVSNDDTVPSSQNL